MSIFEWLRLIRRADNSLVYPADSALSETVQRALDHYCHLCDRGFKTIGGTKNHMRLSHKS